MTKHLEIWSFSDNQQECDKLFNLVKTGVKTATCYLLSTSIENENKFSILTNWNKSEKLLIETTSLEVVEFKNVTKFHAFKEGEGDKSLRYWRKIHKKFFKKILKEKCEKFSKSIKIVCEEFKIIKKID